MQQLPDSLSEILGKAEKGYLGECDYKWTEFE